MNVFFFQNAFTLFLRVSRKTGHASRKLELREFSSSINVLIFMSVLMYNEGMMVFAPKIYIIQTAQKSTISFFGKYVKKLLKLFSSNFSKFIQISNLIVFFYFELYFC